MHPGSAQVGQASIVWILVANGEGTQIYRYHKNRNVIPMRAPGRRLHYETKERHDLTPVPGMALAAESLDDFQVDRDQRGSFIGGQSAHNACEPRLDIHDEVRENLVTALAAQLRQACQNKQFDHLVIAASPAVLGLLRRNLDADTSSRIIAEIPRDFTHDGTRALLAHLQETLTQAHVA